MAELLVWPVLFAYGEATVAYAGELRGLRGGGKLGIWGVRLGWIAQTALLIDQALTAEGFPWGTWAGALNLLSWLVVSVYLGWGCRPRYRLLGLVVMPVALALLIAAVAGGGTGVEEGAEAGMLTMLHVGLMLAGFAAFTVAAGMSALYLLVNRRLKRRDAGLLGMRLPALGSLERLSSRVVLAGLVALTVGVVFALAELGGDDLDLTMGATLVVWLFYAGVLALRHDGHLVGKRLSSLYLLGFALVAIVLPITHFA